MPEKLGNGGNGQENYDEENGKYTYSEESLKKIDKNFSVPFCKAKVLPLLIAKLQEVNPEDTIKEVYEMEEYTEEEKEELDKLGVDFIMIKDGQHICIDLKTVFPYDGEISEDVNLSLFGYDKNVDADTNGYLLRQNMTDFYLFVLPKELLNSPDDVFDIEKNGNIEFEAFAISKDDLIEMLAENFLRNESNQTSSAKSLISSVKNKIIKAYQKVAKVYKETGESVDVMGDYDVEYNEKGFIKELYRTFLGKNKRMMDLFLKLKYKNGKLRKSVLLQLDKKAITNYKKSLNINNESLENDIITKFFNV